MNSIKINIPEGFEVGAFNQQTGEVTFAPIPKNLRERITSFEDVCKEMGKDPKSYICESDDQDDIAANALRQALLIGRCFNADAVRNGRQQMDWGNSNQRKYCHVYVYNEPRTGSSSSGWSLNNVDFWVSYTYCGSRQHFLNEDDAQLAWDLFSDIFINLIK